MTTDPQEDADRAALVILLDDSAPRTPMANSLPDSAFRELVQGARSEVKRSRRHKVTPRSVAIGTVFFLALGGAGAAAAATLTGWQPWVENPDATVRFTLPSGTACEYRIIARDAGNTAEFIAARDYLSSTDVLALADIDGQLAWVTRGEVLVQGDDITTVPAAELYSEDQLYYQAVTGAINNVIWDEMEARGIANPLTGSDLSFGSQSDCAGVNW